MYTIRILQDLTYIYHFNTIIKYTELRYTKTIHYHDDRMTNQ